jgi:hypothetical protein
MINLREEYDIKNLYIVSINKDYIETNKDDNVQYFNDGVKFIAEKFLEIKKDSDGKTIYYESYTECITEQDLSERYSEEPFHDIPDIFKTVIKFDSVYLTNEEKKSGKIRTMRLFKLLQDINMNKELDLNSKVKKIGKK